jgi:Fe-S-cluster containining protein
MYDCRSCGACCDYKWSWPILKKDKSDAVKIPKDMQRDDYPLLKTNHNRCVALFGTVGDCVGCSIYENRPHACQQFEIGSTLCKEARSKKNMPI